MNIGALGALMGDGLQGYNHEQAVQDAQAKAKADAQAEAAKQARQTVLDQQHDTQFSEGQDDRAHALSRRPLLEQNEDQYNAGRLTGQQHNNEIGAHTLAREPTMDAQHDQEFQVGQRLKQMQIAHEGMQAQLAKMGITEKQQALGRQAAADGMGAAIGQYRMTGDISKVAAAYDSLPDVKKGLLSPMQSLTKNADGSFTLQMAGQQPATIPNYDALESHLSNFITPGGYAQTLLQHQSEQAAAALSRAKNPRNFGEVVSSNDGTLQNLDYTTGKASPIVGQDGQPFTGTIAGKERNGNPSQEAAKMFQSRINAGDDPTTAKSTVGKYMDMAYPGVKGSWSPPEPQWGSDGAPPPANFMRGPAAAPTSSAAPSFAKPAPAPAAAQAAPAPAMPGIGAPQFTEGQVYRDANGNTAKYSGGNWIPQ